MQFIDLSTQQDRIRPALERNIHRVLHHGQYVMGPEITTLESRLAAYVGVDHCICVSSGTDALLIAMMALEISPGDEVITTPFTFFAAIETINLLGAKPVFVDIDQGSYALDANLIEAAINDRTKAILPVSLYGQCADMDRINEIANSHQIPVIEDSAQSFGATYKGRRSCSLSQIGCTSFFPAKPLGAYGDAGACFTQDPQLAVRVREIRDHGQCARYEHVRMGVNGRMDTLQAAVLLAKLDIFDEELVSRVQVAEQYAELLKSTEESGLLTLPNLKPYNFSSWAQYTVEVNQRNRVQNSMTEKGIPTAVHYPQPVYAQPALAESVTHCPVTDRVAERVLSLPIHPYLSIETQERVVGLLNQALKC
ncbi:MAG TPA: DegT/DnrJ/EryC1/StrS family aminotransferase [Gammaproteobacteria bacterium]|nr:DegT/DnrJ/EryC1/StrS family aminotransferase [Gammaproteobacteria bacterium]